VGAVSGIHDELPANVWQAMARRRFLLGPWPWRGLAFLVLTLGTWLLFAVPLSLVVAPAGGALAELFGPQHDVLATGGFLLLSLVLGFVLLPLLASPLVRIDRARAPLVDQAPVAALARSPIGSRAWLRDRYLSPRHWRYAGYLGLTMAFQALVLAVVLTLGTAAGALVAAPFIASATNPIDLGPWQLHGAPGTLGLPVVGLVLLAVLAYAWCAAAGIQVELLRRFVHVDASDRLAAQLTEVDRSRARLVGSFDSERLRIERDLHDGAQQRLMALAMNLGLSRLEIEEALGTDHPASVGVAAAHDQAKALMGELRQFVRGIHPRVLTDIGLAAALDQLAATMPIPVSVHSALDARLAAHIETTAYFTTSEALTNVMRHSGARSARVSLAVIDEALVVEVTDDGHGGAAPGDGTGLTGMADRLAVVGGSLALSSPPAGPTVVRMTIPGWDTSSSSPHHE
jgi:signal transduction histidine kinase